MGFKIQRLFPWLDSQSKHQLAQFQKELDTPIRPMSRMRILRASLDAGESGVPGVISCRITVDSSERSDDRR